MAPHINYHSPARVLIHWIELAVFVLKQCKGCEENKAFELFYKQKGTRDGYTTLCKDCTKLVRRRYEATPEYKQARLRRQRKYRDMQTESYLYGKAYRSEWAKANRDKKRAYKFAYLSRKKNATGTATVEQIAARVEYYGSMCWVCSGPWDSIDHYKPLNKGGSNWPANLRPICRPCNAAKKDIWPFNKDYILSAYSAL